MRIFVAVIITAVLSISASVGVTHSIMQEQTRQEVYRVSVESFNDGFLDGACSVGTVVFEHPCK